MSVEVVLEKVTKTFGEGPHWDERTQCLYFVDVSNGGLHRWCPATSKHEKRTIGTTASLIVPCEKGGFIVGAGRQLVHYDWDTEKMTILHEVELDRPTNIFNDGKCDARGRLWAGTMGHQIEPGKFKLKQGNLYSLDVNNTLKKHLDKIDVSNGLAWSLDNKTMYYIDSIPRKVYAFDYDIETGSISSQRTAVEFPKGTMETMGLPDGMAIDVEGMLWVACFLGAKVIRFDPKTGKQLQVIDIPAKRVTSCCWGGKNFEDLYVTCGTLGASEEELKEYPLTGSVFKVTGLGVKGLPAPLYRNNVI